MAGRGFGRTGRAVGRVDGQLRAGAVSGVEEAEACDAFLQSQGLLVRRVASYNLPHCLRITVGDESSCRRVAHAIAQFKGVR